jgi:hypothetical protein
MFWTFSLGTTAVDGSFLAESHTPTVFPDKIVVNMALHVKHKVVAKRTVQSHDRGRKHAYAEQRVIRAIDRYIASSTPANKEKARKWIQAWRAYRTSR